MRNVNNFYKAYIFNIISKVLVKINIKIPGTNKPLKAMTLLCIDSFTTTANFLRFGQQLRLIK